MIGISKEVLRLIEILAKENNITAGELVSALVIKYSKEVIKNDQQKD